MAPTDPAPGPIPDQDNPALWHWHGTAQHAHAGGDQSHVHAPIRAHRRLHDWWAAFLIISILAGAVWAFTASDANECSNALIGALDNSCGEMTTIHDGALGVSIVAVLLFIAALVS